MKKSYIKLYILEFIIFIFLLLNSFLYDFLSSYGMPIFFFIILVIFKLLFGFERDRHRYTKDIILDIIIFLLIFFMIYYLIGIPIGFAKTTSYFSWYGITRFILPLFLSIVLQELLRYAILTKSEGCNGLLISTCILFIFINLTNVLKMGVFDSSNKLFVFFSLSLLPAITNNILATYLCVKTGFKPSIFYQLIISMYPYVLPIVPNPNEYIRSLIDFLLPVAMTYRVYKFLKTTKDEEVIREYRRKSGAFVVPGIIIVALVYFVSGYFKYYAIAIASGSMQPAINPGDVVIIDQGIDKDKIEEGMIVAYRHNGIIIVHRVYNIINYEDKLTFYTKGDANNSVDSWSIGKDDIIGNVTFKINWVGLPTLWVNELLER